MAVDGEFNRGSFSAAVACCAGFFFGPGPMLVAGLSLLMSAISHEYGWNRTMFSAVPLIAAWTAAFSAPLFGRAMDRFGIRRVLLPSTLLFGGGFLWVGILSHETWHFFASYFFIGLAAGAQGPVGYNKIIASWFVRRRGLVMALAAAIGSGLGYAVMPPLLNHVIAQFGWRAAYLVVGGAILLIAFPTSFFLLRERPAAGPGVATAANAVGVGRSEGLRSAAFWQLALALFLGANAFYGTMIHLFPLLVDRGVQHGMAARALSVVAIGAIVGQIAAATLLDRINSPRVSLLFFIGGLAGVLTIQWGGSGGLIYPGALLLGFGQGAELSVIAYLTTRFFGLPSFGFLYGLIYAGANAAAGTGPMIMGVGFDHTGSYDTTLYVLEAFLIVSIISLGCLPNYRFDGRTRTTRGPVATAPA